jgi:hypothetical protein
MKTEVQPIKLSGTGSETTVVKTCALFTFRALRSVAGYVSQIPAVASKAATDIASAWEESSLPKVR